MMDFNTSASLSGRLEALLDVALQTEHKASPQRDYLGASRLGAACERQLQYEYAKASVMRVRASRADCCAFSSAGIVPRTW